VQRSFTKFALTGALLAAAIIGFAGWLRAQPDRAMFADAISVGVAVPAELSAPLPPPIRAARLWRLEAPDPRFGGVSALGVDGRGLVALTDSGVVIRFAPPTAEAQAINFELHDLPGGPGPRHRKAWRDSESLLRDPLGRGWWVGFETRHSLWLFDHRFSRALADRLLGVRWPRNKGAEGMISGSDGQTFALPEGGGASIGVDGTAGPVTPRGTSDATRLPDGRLALLVRRLTRFGFASEVRISGAIGKKPLRLKLPLGPLANAEAIAAVPLGDGATRLWIATDDNFKPWMRTWLLALDLPAGI